MKKTKEKIIQIWQIVFFLTISGNLFYVLANNGLDQINYQQIQITGGKYIDKDKVIKASEIKLPKPLLTINPRILESKLIKNLPIKDVSIKRKLFPNSLEINIKERNPVAYAERNTENGVQEGMIDKEGYWIAKELSNINQIESESIRVTGWMKLHRYSIKNLLKNKSRFATPIRQISFDQNGDISLITKDSTEILLGTNLDLLESQIKALSSISKNLPLELENKVISIDLRNSSQPELQIANP